MKKARIVSYSEEIFQGRHEAACLLAEELKKFQGKNAVVLGIPRGGLLIADEIASRIAADLDIVLSRKLGSPGNPELAIGAVAEDGYVFINEAIVGQLESRAEYIEQEKARQVEVIKHRIEQYRKILPKAPLKDRTVIITDDGVATGATMQAALWATRRESPRRIIAALPVGPVDTIKKLAEDADEIVCLRCPAFFAAIGQFYYDFTQVKDDEVLEILKKEAERKASCSRRLGIKIFRLRQQKSD